MRGSISETDSIFTIRRPIRWREPRIEYTWWVAVSSFSAGTSKENCCRWLPKGAVPETR